MELHLYLLLTHIITLMIADFGSVSELSVV